MKNARAREFSGAAKAFTEKSLLMKKKASSSSSASSSRKSSEDVKDFKEDDLLDPALEKEYLESVRKQTAKGRTITTVGSGILLAAAGGTILGPLVAIPAAIVGMGAGYRMFKNRERRQVDKAEKMLATGDHAVENLPGEEGSSRPPLRRLIFLARWASLQIATDLDNRDLKPARLERVFDETILSFSAWVQRIYFARAEKKASKRDQEVKLLKLHLSPLVRWLGSSPSNEVFMMVNHEFAKDAEKLIKSGGVQSTRIVKRCRSVFPLIVEVYQLFKLGEESKFGQVVLWITDFLRRREISSFLADAVLLHTASPHSVIEDEDHVEFPPLGVEQELEEDEFFSASEGGDESDEELAVSAHIARQATRGGATALVSGSSIAEGVDDSKLFQRGVATSDENEKQVKNTWIPLDATLINVRGPNYLQDKAKIPSKESMFEMLCFDLFYTDHPIYCVSSNKNCKAYWLLKDDPDLFTFTVNWRLHPMQATVTYGIKKSKCDWIKRDCPEKILLERFLEASPDVRNNTIKVIPKVTEGPWLVRKAVGQTPAILGRKLKVEYHEEPGRFFEAEYDVLSTTAAKSMIGLLVGAAKRLVIDVGIILEGKEVDELPERILGGFRVHFPDLAACRRITVGAPVDPPNKKGLNVGVHTDESENSD